MNNFYSYEMIIKLEYIFYLLNIQNYCCIYTILIEKYLWYVARSYYNIEHIIKKNYNKRYKKCNEILLL